MAIYSRSSVGSHTYDFAWLARVCEHAQIWVATVMHTYFWQCSYALNVSVKMCRLFLFPTFSCFCAKRFPVHAELLHLWESELTARRGTGVEVEMTWRFRALFTVFLHGMVECSDAVSSSHLLKRKLKWKRKKKEKDFGLLMLREATDQKAEWFRKGPSLKEEAFLPYQQVKQYEGAFRKVLIKSRFSVKLFQISRSQTVPFWRNYLIIMSFFFFFDPNYYSC